MFLRWLTLAIHSFTFLYVNLVTRVAYAWILPAFLRIIDDGSVEEPLSLNGNDTVTQASKESDVSDNGGIPVSSSRRRQVVDTMPCIYTSSRIQDAAVALSVIVGATRKLPLATVTLRVRPSLRLYLDGLPSRDYRIHRIAHTLNMTTSAV
jgi:hypothetical protein